MGPVNTIDPHVGENGAGSAVLDRIRARFHRVTYRTVAGFLMPEGFAQPTASAVLRERTVVREAGRYVVSAVSERGARRRTPYAGALPPRVGDPVLLVPGFLAGDGSLRLM